MKTPDISTRFLQLSSRYGYKRGIRQLQREFDPDTFAAFATEGRRKVNAPDHAATALKADPSNVDASQRWQHLHARTGA